MDLNSLKDQVSNLTLYDLKAGVRKVQNGEPVIGTTAEAIADLPLPSRHELHGDGGKGKHGVFKSDSICSQFAPGPGGNQ